ncbi:hypothetical protein AAIH68_34910, partial [Pseudomonas aeruginosa]
MKCKTLLIACLFGLGSAQALAVSKLPPQIPVHAGSGRVTLDLRPLLAETNDVEITRVSVCRRVGSHCQETLWRRTWRVDRAREEWRPAGAGLP